MTLHFSPVEAEAESHSVSRGPAIFPSEHTALASAGFYRRVFKRILDVALTLLAAPIIVPLVVIFGALIMLDGHSPFYSQMRIGRGGKVFRMWKLRTMVHNADALLESYLAQNPAARLEWDATQKLKKDPRITLVGRILRKTSLDELVQFWNVMNGTMSLVGPRPMMVTQRPMYTGQSYFNLTPGITGLWQISDRNECDFIDRMRYDETYDRVVSFRTDVWILIRTVGVVLRGTGY